MYLIVIESRRAFDDNHK